MRTWITVTYIFSVIVVCILASSCDEVNALQFVNQTSSAITLRYEIRQSGSDTILADRSYDIPPGATIDTGEDPDDAGMIGLDLFDGGRELSVRAQSGGTTFYAETLTYDHVKSVNFRIVISK